MATPNDVPDVIDPLSKEILHTDVNWFLVEFAPTDKKNKYEVKFSGKGKGGLVELKEHLKSDERIFYGSLQVNLIDGNGTKYDKYVYFKYLPNKANKAKRFLWNFENAIKSAFKFKHVLLEYLDENLTGFSEEGITKEFLRVSENQMEYKSIDFGGNNIYQIEDGKIHAKKPNMANQNAAAAYKKPAAVAQAQGQAKAAAQDEKVDYPDDDAAPEQNDNADNGDDNDNNNYGGGDDNGDNNEDNGDYGGNNGNDDNGDDNNGNYNNDEEEDNGGGLFGDDD